MRRQITSLASLVAAAALTGRAAEAPPGRPPAPVLRETLQDILRSGYRLTEPPEARLRELLARLLRLLRELLSGLSEAGPLAGLPPWMTFLLTGVLAVLMALIIAHIVVGLRGLLVERRGRGETPPAAPERLDPLSVLERAEDAFRRGEHETALRLLYQAVLLRLDRRGLLVHDPARTNWENLRALAAARAEAREAMAGLTREVDACTYGGRRASVRTWEQSRAWADLLWREEAAPS